MNNELAVALSDSLGENILDITSDLLEVGLDSIMEDGLLKDVPILSTAISFFKIGKSINERYNIKKLCKFINEVNKGTIDEEKREIYIAKFEGDRERTSQQLEYLMIIIQRYVEFEKPAMLAKIYLAYLDEIISWDELCAYSIVLDRFLPGDFNTLLMGNVDGVHYREVSGAILRLVALGLMVEHQEGTTVEGDAVFLGNSNLMYYEVTTFGKKLIDCIK